MTFRKAEIPIRIASYIKTRSGVEMLEGIKEEIPEHAEFRDGYEFEAVFSTGNVWSMGVYNTGRVWRVTDISTGYFVCEGKTRKDAVKRFQQLYLSKFERKVMSDEHWPASDSFTNWFEYESERFGKLVKEARA